MLIAGLFGLGRRVINQVVLPNRKRKGNLLSSLFHLFTGLTEQVISFGNAVVCIPRAAGKPFMGQAALGKAWTFSRRYLRQGMLIAAWALFILSSLEWVGPNNFSREPAASEQQDGLAAQPAQRQDIAIREESRTPVAAITYRYTLPLSSHPPASSIHRWLLLCTIRR
jgi:hypothetical protein